MSPLALAGVVIGAAFAVAILFGGTCAAVDAATDWWQHRHPVGRVTPYPPTAPRLYAVTCLHKGCGAPLTPVETRAMAQLELEHHERIAHSHHTRVAR